MKTMIIGLLLMFSGVVLGLYIGLWFCFIGGICQIINEIKSQETVVAMNIALGSVRIIFAAFAGVISAMFLFIPGYVLIVKD